jgi:hypothetical protein
MLEGISMYVLVVLVGGREAMAYIGELIRD